MKNLWYVLFIVISILALVSMLKEDEGVIKGTEKIQEQIESYINEVHQN